MRLALVVAVALTACVDDNFPDQDPTNDAGTQDDSGIQDDAGIQTSDELGRCAPRLGSGAACDGIGLCESPLECIAGRCVIESAAGEPCEYNGHCIPDLFCRRYDVEGRQLQAQVCVDELQLGEACAPRQSGACAGSDNDCIRGACGPESLAGGPCESATDCTDDHWCDDSLTAVDGFNGVCVPDRKPGEACIQNGECARLRCFDGTCQPRREPGEACDSAFDCADSFYCDRYDDDRPERRRDSGACRVEAALGGACDPAETSQCDGGSRCLGGRCVDDVPAGGVCQYNSTCERGLYCAMDE